MPNRTNGLRATALALLVAIASTTAIVAPVAATDPAPVETPSPSPAPDPTPTPTAAPVETPTPTADPAPTIVESPGVDPSVSPGPWTTADPSPAVAAVTTVVAPAAAVVRPNLALRVVRVALAQRGDQYRAGGQGPYYFDCSGLVRYAYRKAGVSAKLGGGSSARGMLYWGRLHHLTSRTNPRIGDVVIYGGGTHAAIYIGNGRVVHALNPRLDIRVTGLHAMSKPFTTYIHTRIPRG